MMQHKKILQLLLLFAILLSSNMTWAAKFDLYFGAYDFSAETNTTSGSKSGAGAYKIAYYVPAFSNIEFGIGYTLILSDTVTGDAAFGFEVEGAWFPLTKTEPITMNTEKSYVRIAPIWRPFAYFGYNVRQFQSVETQYTGFSVGAGVERTLKYDFDFKALVRYVSLSGPNEATADEIDVLCGITFDF